MTIKKEVHTVYLDTRLTASLTRFANTNKLSKTEALESIVRVFFAQDESLDNMVNNQHLEQQIEVLEVEISYLKDSGIEAINSIEKLQEQVAELQEKLNC